MPTVDPSQLAIREMQEDEEQMVLELLKDGFKDTGNRLILYVLTRPLALLLLAVVSSGLRFLLNSFVAALLGPVLLTILALKLLLRRSPDLGRLHAYYRSGRRGLWVAVYDGDDVCGCVALEPRPPGESRLHPRVPALGRGAASASLPGGAGAGTGLRVCGALCCCGCQGEGRGLPPHRWAQLAWLHHPAGVQQGPVIPPTPQPCWGELACK
uniref:N-acetyltransferase 14 (putative) n=1 Tax=Pelodiscus sinensis TaxID=13735 RepID=K7FW10_PELSI